MSGPRPGGSPAAPVPAFEMPEELAIDAAVARRVISEFIRSQLRQAGFERAVLGLSGGIDSALVAYLVAEAIGAERLLCVLLPYRTSSPASRADAEAVVADLGAASELVDISPMVDGYFAADPDASPLRRGNFMARQRMAVLYDRSVTWGGLVVGTGNKTESLIGYTTLFGDSACAFNPIGDLYKTQVRQLAADIGVPDAILRKAPSADLWPGQTDEIEGGFSYPQLDRLLFWRIDKRRSTEEMVALGFDPAADRASRPDGRRGRVQAAGAADRQARAADGRRGLPLPAAPAGLRARVSDPGGALYVVATPIGNLGDITLRALEVLRAVPLIAAEDTRHTHRLLARHGIETKMTSYHARSGPARAAALLEHLRGGADLALVTDAGTPAISDPGGELVAAWAAEGGTVVPLPGASAVLAAVAGSGVAGPRWTFEGFLPRSGRERRERLARIAGDERGAVVYEAPGRVAASLADLAAACGGSRAAAVCRELTKLHESIVRGTLDELAAAAADGRIPARGEFVLVIGPGEAAHATAAASADGGAAEDARLAAALAEVERLVAGGAARGDAARRVAASSGIPRRRLYKAERLG